MEGRLKEVFHLLLPEATPFFTPIAVSLQLLKSKGVHLLDDFIGRRMVLAFWTDRYTATQMTGYPGPWPSGPLHICICAAEPTTGARCHSNDFFVCFLNTHELKKVQIISMFTLTWLDDGFFSLENRSADMYSVVQRLVYQRKKAYEAAKAARLAQFA